MSAPDELTVPDEFDSQSYRAGWSAAMQTLAAVAMQYAEAIEDEDGLGTCSDCGAEKKWSMGHSDPICPDCET